MKTPFSLPALAALLMLGTAGAQTYTIDWYSVDGGGGTSSGGNYTVTGTIGQPDAGTSSGGNYTLTGGFMSVVTAIQTPGAPVLKVTRAGNNVIISWPAPATGFVLQEANALANPSSSTIWNPGATPALNGGEYQVTVPSPAGNKYFRLRQPPTP
jgi:hypothetical protein